jgi:glycosyltransferase involved in cell wall biosynthesis
MLLSIITAAFNSEKTIVKTLNSIIRQNGINELFELEYIIVDGASKDDTINIIKSYESTFKEKGIVFKWISEKDSGIYDAWNKGVKLSSGKWISFLGSDDYYCDGALEAYYNTINNNKTIDYDLVYSNVNLVKGDKLIKNINGTWSWRKFRRYMNIAHVGSFHNKQYFTKNGLFDTSYKIAGDYEFLLRARQNLKALKLNKQTVMMSEGGISNRQISKVFKETFKAKNKTGGLNKIICSFDYAIAYIKFILRKIAYAIY